MRKMKDSGVEWIGEIPEDWEVTKVSRNYKIQTGFTPDTENSSYYDENGEVWVSIADMTGKKYVSESSKKISQIYVNNFNPKKVKKGSLLYSFKLSAGKVCFAKKDLYTNEAIASFESTENSYLPFLYYSAPVFIEKNANENIYGAKLLNQKLILSAKIIYPPIENQIKISHYLDKKCGEIEELIKIQEQEIEKLEEYKKSVIYEAVTKGLDPKAKMKDSGVEWIGEIPEDWEVKEIKKILVFYFGERITKNLNLGSEYPVYGGGGISFFTNKYNRENEWIISRFAISENCIRFVRDKFWVLDSGGTFDLKSDYKNKISKNFIGRTLEALQKEIYSSARGTAQKNLNNEFILELNIPIPEVKEQEEISNFLDKKCEEIDDLISKKQEKIDKLEEYKKSLIFECVTGKREV